MDFRGNTNEFPERHEAEVIAPSSGAAVRRWLAICVVLAAAGCLAFGYGYRQHLQASGTAVQATELRVTVSQLQDQIKALNAKLSDMASAQQAAATQPAVSAPPVAAQLFAAESHASDAAAAKHNTHAAKRGTTQNSSLRRLQARVDAQQKQLAAVEDEMTKARSDLQGDIDSTRDELGGSVAKTHDELVALEKRGQRDYFEFDLTKSKQFQRFGPLMLSLGKADTKHKSYDLNLIVDDNRLSKKHVDLYEPIWLHAGDDAQPLQVVVNLIEKNHVRGYVSAPKYAEARETSVTQSPAARSQPGAASASPAQNQPSPAPPRQE